MSIRMRKKYSKSIIALFAACLSISGILPANYLKAEKVAIEDEIYDYEDLKKIEYPLNETATFGGTKIKLNGMKDIIQEDDWKRTVLLMTLERKEGFENATNMRFELDGYVEIDGEKVSFNMHECVEIKRISDTSISIELPITGVAYKRAAKHKFKSVSDLDTALLNGKEVELRFYEIEYKYKEDKNKKAKTVIKEPFDYVTVWKGIMYEKEERIDSSTTVEKQ